MLRRVHTSLRSPRTLVLPTLAALVLPAILFFGAACGDDSASSPTAAATSAATKPAVTPASAATTAATVAPTTASSLPAAPTPTTAAPAAAATDLKTRDNVNSVGPSRVDALGTVLTDAAGLTLYTFNADQAAPGKSQCNAGCSSVWPPATSAGASPTKPASVSGDLTLITREDGTKQMAYKGRPLYHYASDKAPGDAFGQNVAGAWFVAKP